MELGTILTLADVKEHLSISGTGHDAKLINLKNRCEAVLLDYIGKTPEEMYLAGGESGGEVLKLAALVMVDLLYNAPTEDPLNAAVKSIVRRLRDPVAG